MKQQSQIKIGFILFSMSFFSMADSSGTGFFVSEDGLIVTNFHVIEDAQAITITRSNGKQSKASPLITDKANDIAILQIEDGVQETFLTVKHSSIVSLGTDLVTIGFPLTSIQGKEPKVTSGILSSLSGLNDNPTHFQISVPIQPGNSGGPLIAKDGTVIGIVTSKLNAIGVVRATGDIPQNVNYAVKSSYLVELFNSRVFNTRVKATHKPGPNLGIEEIVRRSLNAVVLVNVKTIPKSKSSESVGNVPSLPNQGLLSVDLDFGNVKFIHSDGRLEVKNIVYSHEKYRTTLRIGDRIVSCFSGREVYTGVTRVYGVEDLEKCKSPSTSKNGKSSMLQEGTSQYIFRIMRLGNEAIGSVIK